MFGAYRTILALMVLVGHIFGPYQLGTYAVFGFYVLSGLLMTTIMHETYGYNLKGQLRYIVNRFLRIYPAYWIAIVISLICIAIAGEKAAAGYEEPLFFPSNLEEILRNIFIIFSYESLPRLSPSAWALTVELFYYLIICFGISKTETRTKFWLLFSFVYTLALLIFDRQWEARYFPIAAASLPFAIGSYLHFLLKRNPWRSLGERQNRYLFPVLLTALMIANFAFYYAIERLTGKPLVFQTGFYSNLVIVTLLVLVLASGGKYPLINKKWDKKIGDFSYPIYLLHWQIGLLVSYLMLGEPYRGNTVKGAIVLLVALPVTLLVSFLMIKAIDRPIEQIRSWMKPKKTTMPPVAEKNVTPLPK